MVWSCVVWCVCGGVSCGVVVCGGGVVLVCGGVVWCGGVSCTWHSAS